MIEYDVIVVGGGAGNIVLDAALEAGLNCAVVERTAFGGTCLNRGCIPTKVLTTVADWVRMQAGVHKLGIDSGPVSVDWGRLSARVWDKIGENELILEDYRSEPNLTVYMGTAAFVGEKSLQVHMNDGTMSEVISAERIVLAVGGRTTIPQIDGLLEAGYLTSGRFFSAQYPVKPYDSLIILGGGAIGVEFAHIFSALGTEVTIVQRNVRLIPKADEEISEALLRVTRGNGVTVHLNHLAVSIRDSGLLKHLTIQNRATGETQEVSGSEILLAPGITSNADWLELSHTQVEVDENGWIRTNEFMETTAPGIYALGDINGKPAMRHRANYEAEILAHNLFNRKAGEPMWRARYDLVPYGVFSYPQVAHVGLTEKAARETGQPVSVGRFRLADTAKGYALGLEPQVQDYQFVKLVANCDTGEILGVHIVGHEATLLLQSYVYLLNAGPQPNTLSEPDIEHDDSRSERQSDRVQILDPHSISLINQSMIIHPSLSEAAGWVVGELSPEQDGIRL